MSAAYDYMDPEDARAEALRVEREVHELLVDTRIGEDIMRAQRNPDSALNALLQQARRDAVFHLPALIESDLFTTEGIKRAQQAQHMVQRYEAMVRWIANALSQAIVAQEQLEAYVGEDESRLADAVNGRTTQRATDA